MLQGSLHSLCAMSIVSSGMQQEHHVHQAVGTHCRKGAELLKQSAHLATLLGSSHWAHHTWGLCDRGLRTLYTLPDRCQGEYVGDARL